MRVITPYDEVPYSNHAYHQTHPDLLATIARLKGLSAASPTSGRVLELACGGGANLVALGYALPGVRATGIDLAPSAIEQARALARRLGVSNVEFQQGDVTQLTDGRLGEFDYIVAHGLYAWVPDVVRDGLLATIAAHLSPEGIGYVSYNAQPTGHIRSILREAALWWGRDAGSSGELADRTRELFGALLDHRCPQEVEDWYGQLLRMEARNLRKAADAELVHDLLGDHWRPVWFKDFVDHAAQHRLAYVGSPRFVEYRRRASLLPYRLDEILEGFSRGDPIVREQYEDILTNRPFRESLLCHAGRPVRDELDPAAFAELSYRPGPAVSTLGDNDPPELRAAADVLRSRRPRAVPFAELAELCGAEPEALRALLQDAFERGVVYPHTALPEAARPGERPRASEFARMGAVESDRVTTLYNGIVFMQDPLGKKLIELMDGTRDRDQLLEAFRAATGADVTREVLDANIESLGEIPLFHA